MAAQPVRIFDYYDYARYLRDYYEAFRAENRWFSYKYIHTRTGVEPGFLYKIFQGKKHLPSRAIPRFAALLNLSSRERDYFSLLVSFAKAKNNDEIKAYFEKILRCGGSPCRKVDANAYEYYTRWYYAAVRQILSYYPFTGDFHQLAKLTVPEITAAQAKKAVTLLQRLGFIEKGANQRYRLTDQYLTTGEEWRDIAIGTFQKDTIMLAHRALDAVSKDERDISTVTVTLSEKSFDQARELVRQFRQDMLRLAQKEEQADRAFHVNIQMVPIGRPWKGEPS